MSSVCVEIVVQTNCTAQWVVIQHAVKNLSRHPALMTTCRIYSSWLDPAARWLPLENVDLVSTICNDDYDYDYDDDNELMMIIIMMMIDTNFLYHCVKSW